MPDASPYMSWPLKSEPAFAAFEDDSGNAIPVTCLSLESAAERTIFSSTITCENA
jgi:hypothetical protein